MVWIMMLLILLLLYLWMITPALKRKDAAGLLGKRYAHRGLHDGNVKVVENTLEAFRLAHEKGLGVELDVQLSRDGEVMVFHDETLKRVLGAEGKLSDKTAAELGRMGVPAFGEALKVLAGAPLIVEVKGHGKWRETTDKAAALLESYPGPWCMESFHPQVVQHLKKKHPRIIRGQLAMGGDIRQMGHPVREFMQKHLLHLFLGRPDFVAYQLNEEKPLSWRLMKHVFRLPMACWTVKGAEQEALAARQKYDMVIFEEAPAKDD